MAVFFSIVVASFNAGELIKNTINSILEQDFDDFEIVVKDGLSTDNTLEMVPVSEKIRVYSEKDTSVYDAMNQGIGYCTGKYIAFINCGDVFYDNTVLRKIYSIASKYENADNIIYGDLSKLGNVMKQMPKVTARKLYRTTLCHQTLFVGEDVFKKCGLYDTKYKLCADYEHIMRSFRSGVSFVYADCIVVDYEGGGLSEQNSALLGKENIEIRKRYFSVFERFKYRLLILISLNKLRAKFISNCKNESVIKFYRKIANFLVKKGII